MRRRLGWVLVIVAALAAFNQTPSAQIAADAKSSSAQESKTLVGAWFITVTPTLRPAFVSVGTFSSDGTLTNISSPSLGFPPESPGYGVWVKTGKRTSAITFVTVLGDGAGNFAGTDKVRAILTVSSTGDGISGVFRVDVFDPGGMLIVSDTGTVQGTRIKVEPL